MFGDKILKLAPSTEAKQLLIANEGSPTLDEYHHNMFHYNASKLLYITKIARPDIEPNLAFLCTLVGESDEDD